MLPAADPVVFPDAAAVTLAHLRSTIPAVRSYSQIPPKYRYDEPLVIVYRTGGVSRDVVVDDAQLTVECFDVAGAGAHDLAQLARAHINAMAGQIVDGTTVYQVAEFSGPAWAPLNGNARYRQTFQIGARGVTI